MLNYEMVDLLMCNRLEELSKQIDGLHLNYLHLGESLDKIEQRKKLEGCIKEFLCLVPHSQKFTFTDTADILHTSATTKDDFSGYKAASAWNAISAYATNLMSQPWRKEYRELKMYCGFYKHEVNSNLVGAERMLIAMGYKPTSQTTMLLEGPIDPDRVSTVSRDSLIAFVECQVLKSIWEEVSSRFNCGWLEVLEFRENHICSPENAVRGLMYQYHQQQYREQQQLAAMDVYGTARFHHVPPNCLYGSTQPMGYYNNSSMYPHTYTLPPQARYMPYQPYAIPTYQPLPAPVQPQELYHTNGHYHLSHPAPVQNGYALPPPAAHVNHNYSVSVPTGKLIELDASAPSQSSPETQRPHIYSTTDSSSSVLIPQSVRQHTASCKKVLGDNRQNASKPKEEGVGTFDSWDYVYRDLENQGYNKDLGERPDILSPELDRDEELEQTLMELRLEECSKNIGPGHRNLKINEALQQIKQDNCGEAAKPPAKDKLESSTSVYDNMSSPPRDKQPRPNPASTLKHTRTLPRDARQQQRSEEKPALTLDHRKLRDHSLDAKKGRGKQDDRWQCKICTFLNVSSRDVCEMCSKSRRLGAEIQPLVSGGRECPKCTLVNEKGVDVCMACDNSLKNSPTYI